MYRFQIIYGKNLRSWRWGRFSIRKYQHGWGMLKKVILVIQGCLPSRAHEMVLEWASLHRDELLEDWKLAIEKKVIKKIEPLK